MVNIEQVHIFCAYLLMAYLALVSVTLNRGSFLSLPIFATIIFTVFAHSALIVWASRFKEFSRLEISHAFARTKVTATQFDLMYICSVLLSALKANARNMHRGRLTSIWSWLLRTKLRSALSRAETTGATRPCFKSLSAVFANASLHMLYLALCATSLRAKLVFSTSSSCKLFTAFLTNKGFFHDCLLMQLYPMHSKYITKCAMGQS